MSSSQLRPRFSGLAWHTPRFLILLVIHHFINVARVAAQQQLTNISIPITSPQIVYTPFVCNASTVLADPQQCAGAWQLSSSNSTISATGPSSGSGGIIPQFFFEFRASNLTLTTTPSSNASVNLTVSANGKDVWAIFESSSGTVSVIDLSPNQTTILAITFIPAAGTRIFGLESLTISVPQNTPTSSIFSTQTLPPFTSFQTSVPTSTGPSASSAVVTALSNKSMVTEAALITIGLGLGLTTVVTALFYCWRARKRRLEGERAKLDW